MNTPQTQNGITYGQTSSIGGDPINNLPSDQTVPSHNEIQVVDTLFKHQYTTIQKLLIGAKESIVLALLFVIFSLPQVDDIIKSIVKSAESPYVLIGIKAILLSASYFIISNLYLVKK